MKTEANVCRALKDTFWTDSISVRRKMESVKLIPMELVQNAKINSSFIVISASLTLLVVFNTVVKIVLSAKSIMSSKTENASIGKSKIWHFLVEMMSTTSILLPSMSGNLSTISIICLLPQLLELTFSVLITVLDIKIVHFQLWKDSYLKDGKQKLRTKISTLELLWQESQLLSMLFSLKLLMQAT